MGALFSRRKARIYGLSETLYIGRAEETGEEDQRVIYEFLLRFTYFFDSLNYGKRYVQCNDFMVE